MKKAIKYSIIALLLVGCESKSDNKATSEDWKEIGIANGYTNAAQQMDSLFDVYHNLGSRHLIQGDRDSARIEQGRMQVCLELSVSFAKQSQQILNKYRK